MTDEELQNLTRKVEENTKSVNELISLVKENNERTAAVLRKILSKQDKESKGHFWREVGANLTGDVITLLFLEEALKGKK